MSRPHRQRTRLFIKTNDLGPIVQSMKRLAAAQDGWVNVLAATEEPDTRTPRLGFFALFGGGSSGATMCTWIPGSRLQHGDARPSLGITHTKAKRVIDPLLAELGLPDGWRVEQDHPRRGLIIRLPSDGHHERALAWGLAALRFLGNSPEQSEWIADVYLPA